MSDYGIKPEWKEAWRWLSNARDYLHGPKVADRMLAAADLAAHLLAGWMRERFELEHWTCDADGNYCAECGGVKECDPRHNYESDDWLREAREELGK